MRRNELMVGDWVWTSGHPVQIETISRHKVGYLKVYHKCFEFLEPIPLTAEILEANGFVKDGYTNLSPDYRLEVREGDYKGYSIFVNLHTTCDKKAIFGGYDLQDIEHREIICYGGRNIHKWYVHELQRALRSINLFDLADNFKIQ